MDSYAVLRLSGWTRGPMGLSIARGAGNNEVDDEVVVGDFKSRRASAIRREVVRIGKGGASMPRETAIYGKIGGSLLTTGIVGNNSPRNCVYLSQNPDVSGCKLIFNRPIQDHGA